MTIKELNSYIKHYLEKDKTNTAIMLTGEWGSGKSYYVENELIPFLKSDKKNRCVVVSLYGLNDISDISKSIYMELKMKKFTKVSEPLTAGKLIAKTVIKGLIEKFGINANMSEHDFKRLYSSFNLSGKLLILEDLERSNIEITNLLGYINNLVERDGVKVLIVANENEILNRNPEKINFTKLFQTTSEDNKEDNKNDVAENVLKYLRIKEKTISDTICFDGDYFNAVKNIIVSFDNQKLQEIIDNDVIKEIASVVKGSCYKNLRTFIFATQKTTDIFDRIEQNLEKDFLKCIYFGMINFSAKIKSGDFPTWEGTKFLSTILGINKYPLCRFCYDYIRWHRLDTGQIEETKNEYRRMKLYDENADDGDEDLQKLYGYYVRTEVEIIDALKSIEEKLKNPKGIAFYHYGKLAAYLVIMKYLLGFDYACCKKNMIENIRGRGDYIDSDLLFLRMYDLEESEKKEYDDFIRQLSESMDYKNTQSEFSYNPDNIKDLYDSVIERKYNISNNHQFISKYDANKIVKMLFNSSAVQIHDFRRILLSVYRYASKNDFVENDRYTMKDILERIQEKIEKSNCDLDKIQLKQLDWLCQNLKTFITQMS